MKPIALFDMDGSLFDYEGVLRTDIKKLASPNEPELSDDLWGDEKKYPYLKARMDIIKAVPGWWENLPVITNGMHIFNLAAGLGFDCQILTKGPKSHPLGWAEKLKACQHKFGKNINVHITQDKGLVYGKVLYDDFPSYMDKWLRWRPRGLGIMPVTPYNKDYTHPQVIKWDGTNYNEVVHALQKIMNE